MAPRCPSQEESVATALLFKSAITICKKIEKNVKNALMMIHGVDDELRVLRFTAHVLVHGFDSRLTS